MRCLLPSILLLLLFSAGCVQDYDVAEVAPSGWLESEHHDEGDQADAHHDNEDVVSHGEATPSGHNHPAGERNHGTQWFFNQPWAAPFIWGKLARDGFIFLALAGLIFAVTARRRR